MKYTPEQLEKMSNHEINIAIAEKENLNFRVEDLSIFVAKKHDGENVISIEGVFDPCGVWNDVMPLAKKYKARMNFDMLGEDKNPKRLVCEWVLQKD